MTPYRFAHQYKTDTLSCYQIPGNLFEQPIKTRSRFYVVIGRIKEYRVLFCFPVSEGLIDPFSLWHKFVTKKTGIKICSSLLSSSIFYFITINYRNCYCNVNQRPFVRIILLIASYINPLDHSEPLFPTHPSLSPHLFGIPSPNFSQHHNYIITSLSSSLLISTTTLS